MDLKIEKAEALILKPGDRVLLLVSHGWTHSLIDEARGLLRGRFPDVEFTFMSDIDEVVVVKARFEEAERLKAVLASAAADECGCLGGALHEWSGPAESSSEEG